MTGICDLGVLLRDMRPELSEKKYVFCTLPIDAFKALADCTPLCVVHEPEGVSLIMEETTAMATGLSYDGTYRKITLQVQSSLQAVGLTAAVSGALADQGISANVVAAYYHDYIFVEMETADQALDVLNRLSLA